MTRVLTFIFMLWAGAAATGQNSRPPVLDKQQAARLARLPFSCIPQQYPNKPSHTYETEGETTLTPRQLHPSFYGCLDWHSSVHGHWMLVRLLKQFPDLPLRDSVEQLLDQSFDPARIAEEAAYFTKYKLAATFERTYGWAWLLKLDAELSGWNTPQAARWHTALQPLTAVIVQLWTNFLPKQTYPNRTGVHPNTAFGLVFALDYARAAGNKAFENLIISRSKDYYGKARAVAALQEPDGTDFLSPSLEVAHLMSKVLPPAGFAGWFKGYIGTEALDNVMRLPVISDRTDYQIVHLDGLALSRAWCLKAIAEALPAGYVYKQKMQAAARNLLQQTLPHITAGNYGGEHWLASFAIYAMSSE